MNIMRFVMTLIALALLMWLNAEAFALGAQKPAKKEEPRGAAPHMPAHTH